VKRLITLITISLLLTSFATNTTFAQQLPKKTLNQAVVDGDIDQVKSEISAGADVNSEPPNRNHYTAYRQRRRY